MHKGSNRKKGIKASRHEVKQDLHMKQHIYMNDIQDTNETQATNKTPGIDNSKTLVCDLNHVDFHYMTRIEKIRWKEQQRRKMSK